MTMKNEETPKEPRIERTVQKAVDFLYSEEVRYFPLDPINIIKSHGWKLKKYSKIAKRVGISTQREFKELMKEIGSEDAVVVRKNDQYAISYNDLQTPRLRINFTLMHEVGHIIFGHLLDFPSLQLHRGGIKSVEYRVLEAEADCFARNALTPAVVASLFLNLRDSLTRNIFGLTPAAWYIRKKRLSEDLELSTDNGQQLQIQQFWGFIAVKTCLKCGKRIMPLPKGSYCPFCGGQNFVWRNDTMKYEDVYRLDGEGRPAECPVCENQELDGGDFCKICGAYFVNKCANEKDVFDNDSCGLPADGNARFCIHCGSKTTYFNKGWLKPWNGEEEKPAETIISQVNDDDLPF